MTPDDILHGTQLALANTPQARMRHRIAAFLDIDWNDPLEEATLGALLRHEIRHAEQFDALGAAFFELYDLAYLVCSWKVGGMPRGAALYGLIPAEMDSNTAAARFLRERRPSVVQDVLESDDGQLARSHTDPGPLSDLPTKMVAFLFLLREIADDPGTLAAGTDLRGPLAVRQRQGSRHVGCSLRGVNGIGVEPGVTDRAG
jgi:hypothetical protein